MAFPFTKKWFEKKIKAALSDWLPKNNNLKGTWISPIGLRLPSVTSTYNIANAAIQPSADANNAYEIGSDGKPFVPESGPSAGDSTDIYSSATVPTGTNPTMTLAIADLDDSPYTPKEDDGVFIWSANTIIGVFVIKSLDSTTLTGIYFTIAGGFTPTADQLAAMNSTITQAKVSTYDGLVGAIGRYTAVWYPRQEIVDHLPNVIGNTVDFDIDQWYSKSNVAPQTGDIFIDMLAPGYIAMGVYDASIPAIMTTQFHNI